jgi:hypothetical protein
MQMQEVDPRVSTDYKFLTNTPLLANLLAVKARVIMIVTRIPSGTLAKIMPMTKAMTSINSKP